MSISLERCLELLSEGYTSSAHQALIHGQVDFAASGLLVSVTDFGAIGNGVVDDTAAIQAAIDSFDLSGSRGGIVYFPFGTYKISASIVVDKAVWLLGSGGSRFYPGTKITVPAGVTAFKFYNATSSPTGTGADWARMSSIYVFASSRDLTNTTGDVTAATSVITVSSLTSFSVGQIIRVAGAGPNSIMQGVWGNQVTAGSAVMTVIPANSNAGVFSSAGSLGPYGFIKQDLTNGIPGTRVAVAGVTWGTGKAYTYVTNISGNSITMADTSDVSLGPNGRMAITMYEDLYGEIQSINTSTKEITIESNNGDGHTVTSAPVLHADAGVSLKCRIDMQNCSFDGFAGNGVHMRASSGDTPASNANLWRMHEIVSINCANGMGVYGVDANAGLLTGCDFSINREWCLIDASQLGNTYVATHASSGRGYKTISSVNRAMFCGAYEEGGTYSSFTSATCVVGGEMGFYEGGGPFGSNNSSGRATAGPAQFGDAASFSDMHVAFLPFGPRAFMNLSFPTLWQLRADASQWPNSVEQDFRQSLANDGSDGWWGYFPQNVGGYAPFLWSDGDADVGKGFAWVPNGIYIGNGVAPGTLSATLSETLKSFVGMYTAAPVAGTWKVGDRVFNSAPAEAGVATSKYTITGWICTVAGTPGTWLEMRCLTGN